MKKSILILTLFLFNHFLVAQKWVTTIHDTAFSFNNIIETTKGDYLVSSRKGHYNGNTTTNLTLIDTSGKIKWSKITVDKLGTINYNLGRCFNAPDGNFISQTIETFSKISATGEVLWISKDIGQQLAPYGEIIPNLASNGVVIPNGDIVFSRLDYDAFKNPIYSLAGCNGNTGEFYNGPTLTSKPTALISDSKYLYVFTQTEFIRFNFDLSFIDSRPLVNPIYFISSFLDDYQHVIRLDDGGFVYSDGSFLNKIDNIGQPVWRKKYEGLIFLNKAKDGFIYSYNDLYRLKMVKLDLNGNVLWDRWTYLPLDEVSGNYKSRYFQSLDHSALSDKNGNIVLGVIEDRIKDVPSPLWEVELYLKIMKFSNWDSQPESNIIGAILNKDNCSNSTGTILKGVTVKMVNSKGVEYWATSDSLGRFSFTCDTGSYSINTIPQNDLWKNCQNNIMVRAGDTINLSLHDANICPGLSVSMSISFLRRCFSSTYNIRYCNQGTADAQDAYVIVTLDSLLKYTSSSRPLDSQTGRSLKFKIGNLAVGDCGSFDVHFYVACSDSTRLNQTLCSEAHIYPDAICTPNTLWSGANIIVTGKCETDSVRFTVKNQGAAPSGLLNSVVVEDQVQFLRTRVQLGVGASRQYAFPANGSTWRMIVEQEQNHPTSTAPTMAIEGCQSTNNTQPISTGFVNMFPNDDKSISIDIDCLPIQGAYDPNDKTGYPTGYGTDKIVAQNQDIEYLIRFQNTGTDTAFTVVVTDTIPKVLDISNIELGASSHPYTAELVGNGVLKFTFNKINLVDSFKNEVLSHGFVRYRINQKKDLAIGTKIQGQAAIYFDFNEPVLTNKTLHTVGKDLLLSIVLDNSFSKNFSLKVYPNPFKETANIELEKLNMIGNSQFSDNNSKFLLYNLTGQLIRTEFFNSNKMEFQRKGLTQGLYIFKIENNGQIIGSGKLIAE